MQISDRSQQGALRTRAVGATGGQCRRSVSAVSFYATYATYRVARQIAAQESKRPDKAILSVLSLLLCVLGGKKGGVATAPWMASQEYDSYQVSLDCGAR